MPESKPNYAIRAPTIDDLHAVVALVNDCSIAEGGHPDETAQNLLFEWNTAGFALATNAWVATAPDGKIVGYEQVDVGDQGARCELDGYVHPNFTGQGIGADLLRLAEDRARAALDIDAHKLPARLHGNIAAANAGARQLFSDAGYQLIRHFWRMEIELHAPPAAPMLPASVRIRNFVPGQDERATHTTIEAAFEDHWDHAPIAFDEWSRRLIERDDFDPAFWFLATAGDEVIGTALCFARAAGLGWVRGLGVRRGWRGRGLGLALLLHAFGTFYERGHITIGLGVDAQSPTGATRLYQRAGMRVTEEYQTYEKVLSSK
jgi:mycothiol synthase